MSTELKVFKYGGGQAICIENEIMEALNLEIDDFLNIEKSGEVIF